MWYSFGVGRDKKQVNVVYAHRECIHFVFRMKNASFVRRVANEVGGEMEEKSFRKQNNNKKSAEKSLLLKSTLSLRRKKRKE